MGRTVGIGVITPKKFISCDIKSPPQGIVLGLPCGVSRNSQYRVVEYRDGNFYDPDFGSLLDIVSWAPFELRVDV